MAPWTRVSAGGRNPRPALPGGGRGGGVGIASVCPPVDPRVGTPPAGTGSSLGELGPPLLRVLRHPRGREGTGGPRRGGEGGGGGGGPAAPGVRARGDIWRHRAAWRGRHRGPGGGTTEGTAAVGGCSCPQGGGGTPRVLPASPRLSRCPCGVPAGPRAGGAGASSVLFTGPQGREKGATDPIPTGVQALTRGGWGAPIPLTTPPTKQNKPKSTTRAKPYK